MKTIVMRLLALFFAFNVSLVCASTDIPDEFFVREHWISLTKSYDIETARYKMGTLYRRLFSFLLTYDFYDPWDRRIATARASFFSFGAHLDVFDVNEGFIGSVDEKVFNVFPTFDVLGKDGFTKLARAEMNFWGTKFYIYDPETGREMAVMSRPYFRLKNDWTINVTNRALLERNQMDSRLLITVLSVQGEIEDWKKDHDYVSATRLKLAQQVQATSKTQLSNQQLESLADELEVGFKAAHPDDPNQTDAEHAQAFVSYCLEKAHESGRNDAQKQAIVTLLNMRLGG